MIRLLTTIKVILILKHKSLYDIVKNDYNQLELKATHQSSVTWYIQAVHERVKYESLPTIEDFKFLSLKLAI